MFCRAGWLKPEDKPVAAIEGEKQNLDDDEAAKVLEDDTPKIAPYVANLNLKLFWTLWWYVWLGLVAMLTSDAFHRGWEDEDPKLKGIFMIMMCRLCWFHWCVLCAAIREMRARKAKVVDDPEKGYARRKDVIGAVDEDRAVSLGGTDAGGDPKKQGT
jgi:hypothetical protein